MKITTEELNGTVLRNNETYLVEDNELLNKLTVSKTVLHIGQETFGHKHPGYEEVYFFKSGSGRMKLGRKTINVTAGDIVLIEDGKFHKVYNDGFCQDLVFVCVFQHYNREDK